MEFGFGVLRLSSRDFWSLTPRELQAAGAHLVLPMRDSPDRRVLADLMNLFPDS